LPCPSCSQQHPVASGRTPLHVLAAPLHTLTGHLRFYNLLDRERFRYVEEVAATPDMCLLGLRNVGPKFLRAVRKVIADLHVKGTDAADGAHDLNLAIQVMLPVAVPEVTGALRAIAAWAQAERGGRTLGDVLAPADGIDGLPPDIARAWELITGTSLRSLADPPDDEDLPYLAEDLLHEVDQRRRLILTARTLAPQRRTYDSLAAELGVTRERVRQLEQSSCHQLALAAEVDRYAPLRWRALTIAGSVTGTPDPPPGSPPWMGGLLAWLAKAMHEAEHRSSPSSCESREQPESL
jgi:Sigma-70, region 4